MRLSSVSVLLNALFADSVIINKINLGDVILIFVNIEDRQHVVNTVMIIDLKTCALFINDFFPF